MSWEDRIKVACSTAMVIFLVVIIGLSLRGSIERVSYGKASWYSYESCVREDTSGIDTASGERFYDNKMTCAMRSRDFGKIYIVTNLENGKEVIVYHNDYGPTKQVAERGVIVDLSKAAFAKIADLKKGVIKVKVIEFK